MRLKYVIFLQHSPGNPDRQSLFVPVVFPDAVPHSCIKIEGDKELQIDFKPVRAGFVRLHYRPACQDTIVECYGASVSLKLTSDALIDARLINDHIIRGFPLQHQLIYETYDAEVQAAARGITLDDEILIEGRWVLAATYPQFDAARTYEWRKRSARSS